jgi:hypothetical protein
MEYIMVLFPEIFVCLSCDGFGETGETSRPPTLWYLIQCLNKETDTTLCFRIVIEALVFGKVLISVVVVVVVVCPFFSNKEHSIIITIKRPEMSEYVANLRIWHVSFLEYSFGFKNILWKQPLAKSFKLPYPAIRKLPFTDRPVERAVCSDTCYNAIRRIVDPLLY